VSFISTPTPTPHERTRVGWPFKKPTPTLVKRVARRLASPILSASSSKVRTPTGHPFGPKRLYLRSHQEGRGLDGIGLLPQPPGQTIEVRALRKAVSVSSGVGRSGSPNPINRAFFRRQSEKDSGASNSREPPQPRLPKVPNPRNNIFLLPSRRAFLRYTLRVHHCPSLRAATCSRVFLLTEPPCFSSIRLLVPGNAALSARAIPSSVSSPRVYHKFPSTKLCA